MLIYSEMTCTTKPLFKLLTHCLSSWYLKHYKKYLKVTERKTVKGKLLVVYSSEVANKLDKLWHARALDSFDVSMLYTHVLHSQLKARMKNLLGMHITIINKAKTLWVTSWTYWYTQWKLSEFVWHMIGLWVHVCTWCWVSNSVQSTSPHSSCCYAQPSKFMYIQYSCTSLCRWLFTVIIWSLFNC